MVVRPFQNTDDIAPLMAEQYAPEAVELLLGHPAFDPRRAWVAEENGRIIGFACCAEDFLACFLGDCEELLDAVRQDAGLRGYGRLKVSYFCPIRLPMLFRARSNLTAKISFRRTKKRCAPSAAAGSP